jgi:hypothetical protein
MSRICPDCVSDISETHRRIQAGDEVYFCPEHGCVLCGGVMLADTEDWKVHLCFECWASVTEGRKSPHSRSSQEAALVKLIDAAYERGRRSVLGDPQEGDDDADQ